MVENFLKIDRNLNVRRIADMSTMTVVSLLTKCNAPNS